MWPWAHVAVAYLLLSAVRWVRSRGRPSAAGTLAVTLGALVPDLVDKPLAWYLDVLPYGRTLAHSLLFGTVLLSAVWVLARRSRRDWPVAAFAIGYLAHLAGDGYEPFLLGTWEDLFFLAWPLTRAPRTGEVSGVLAQLRQVEPTPFLLFESALTVIAVAVWWRHGRPGLPVRDATD